MHSNLRFKIDKVFIDGVPIKIKMVVTCPLCGCTDHVREIKNQEVWYKCENCNTVFKVEVGGGGGGK